MNRTRRLIALVATALVVVALVAGLVAVTGGPRAAAATSVSFAAFGDPNASGYQVPPDPFTKVMAGIRASGATFTLGMGDYINDLPDSAGSSFALYADEEALGMPVWRVPGDNDHLTDGTRSSTWNAEFPELPTSPDPSRRYYSVDVGGIHLVVLSTDAPSIGHLGDTQKTWLEADLAAVPQPATIVVAMHEPLVDGKTGDAYSNGYAAEAQTLRTLFAKYGVDMVLGAHVHVFRRLPVTVGGKTIQYVTVPAAGSRSHLTFGSSSDSGIIPRLESAAAGWETSSSYKGFLKIDYDDAARTLTLHLESVSASSGAVAEVVNGINGNPCGGTFADVLAGESPPPVDTTPPVTKDDAPAAWTNQALTIHLSASDSGSGMSGGSSGTVYSTDGGSTWTPGTAVTVSPDPAAHTTDALQVLYRSTDAAGNVEANKRCTARVDTRRPSTSGSAVSVRRGGRATFWFTVADPKPGSPRTSATRMVRIRIRNAHGTLVKTLTAIRPYATNAKVSYVWAKCTLARGTYRYAVYATDQAGNRQLKAGGNRLVVK